jgi:hypothetical protein
VLIEEWTNQERVAMEKRGDHLNIYNVATDKCWKLVYSAFGIVRWCVLVPTMAEIRLKLAETEVQKGNLSGVASALTEGLAIEKSQCVWHHFAYGVIN